MAESQNNKDEIDKIRVNITMSSEIVNYYQELSVQMGIPRSTCMVIALKSYMDQQNMLKIARYLPEEAYKE